MSNNNYSSQRLSLLNTDSATSPPRPFPQVAFFPKGVATSESDLRTNSVDVKRRQQAISTAPRRNRYDEDDDEKEDNEDKKRLYGFGKTPAVPILQQSINQQTQSLPQTQSGITLIPSFRVDPPVREDSDDLDYFYTINAHRNRCLSGPLP